MDTVYKGLFSPWLSQEKITKAIDTKRKYTIYCRYRDNFTDKDRTGLLNEKTREILWADPRPIVGMKMFGVFLYVQPIAATIRLGMHIAKFPYQLGKIFYTSMLNLGNDLFACRFKSAIVDRLILDLLAGLVQEVVTRAFKIVRTVWYTFAMSMAAFCGFMFTPDIGKRLYSLLETELNGKNREKVPKDKIGIANQIFFDETLWLPPCPHPWGSLDDTYVNSDGQKENRYTIIDKSPLASDFPTGAKCDGQPNYCIYPCLPCYG